MTITCNETIQGQWVYSLSAVKTMAGLNAVRGAVMSETALPPVDGSVILGEGHGSPHAEIVFPQPVALDVITRAEEIGAAQTSRAAELRLR